MSNQLPLTFRGRSPVDPIRLRWGGLGSILLGIALAFQGTGVAVFFALIFIALGVTAWALTGFGSIAWSELSSAKKSIVSANQAAGLLFLYTFFFCFFVTLWVIRMVAGRR